MRRIAHLLVIVLALSVLAACQTHSLYRTTSTVAPAKTPTPPSGSSSQVQQLRPPTFTLVAKSGKQDNMPGAYFWQLANGLAAQVQSAGFETANFKPLSVKQNEQLTINVSKGPYPKNLDLKIYPQDGNYVDIPDATGVYKEFRLKTDPLQTHSFTSTPYQWTANVPPGGYFIFMSGNWDNPFTPPATTGTPKPTRQVTAEMAFWIVVK